MKLNWNACSLVENLSKYELKLPKITVLYPISQAKGISAHIIPQTFLHQIVDLAQIYRLVMNLKWPGWLLVVKWSEFEVNWPKITI